MDLTPSSIITHTSDTNTQTPPPPPPPPTTTTTTTAITQLPNNNKNSSTSNPKSSSFTNGSLKRHSPNLTAAAAAGSPPKQPPSPMVVFSYKECLKNHAATIGGHALDGCGEFMPSSSSNPAEPRSLTCAACGCHRNFHRRDHHTQHQDQYHHPNFLSFYHSPPQRQPPSSLGPHRGLSVSTSPSLSPSPSPSPISSPSPPPISHHFPPYNNSNSYSAPPNMLLALGNNDACNSDHDYHHQNHRGLNSSVVMTKIEKNHVQKKRYRTKFSQEQKQKMLRFSEKLGWRMQKGEETLVQEFCNEVGVPREVFKVWMHNNKNNFRKRSLETMVNNDKNNGENTVVDENNVNNGDRNGNGIDNPCDNDIHRD